MHLVIGADEFLGRHVSRALAAEAPVIELTSDADAESLDDAIKSVDVVHHCALGWSPARRLRYQKGPPPLLSRIVDAARRAGVRRIVHLSTADVYGHDQTGRINERTRLKPVHAFEKLKLAEDQWLLDAAADLEVVILRPARVFGEGEDWILPRLMHSIGRGRGRLWLPGGGRVVQTFVAASDVGRACLAAADRGRPGRSYLVGGFESSWRDLLESAARQAGIGADIISLPYDVAFVKALATETATPRGAVVWPGVYSVDVIGRPHLYDDSYTRRELTWSPVVGSFEQAMPTMSDWLAGLGAGAVGSPRAI